MKLRLQIKSKMTLASLKTLISYPSVLNEGENGEAAHEKRRNLVSLFPEVTVWRTAKHPPN